MLKLFTRQSRKVKRDGILAPLVDPAQCVYAVGDIHGRVDLLDRLIRKIVAEHQTLDDGRTMVLVFLGDYIDRGDQTRETLDYLIRLVDAGDGNIHLLMGNHEAALLEFVDEATDGSSWLTFGGLQTVASYGVPVPGADPSGPELQRLRHSLVAAMGAHVDFLRGLQPYWRSGDYFFSHAGVDPDKPLEVQTRDTLLFGNAEFIGGRAHRRALVVHGHYDAVDPVVESGRICVDTGAYYSGKLTAVRLNDGVKMLST
jgi:serine/threonine protein phosphatase 1